MKTVQDYLDLWLVFVGGDTLDGIVKVSDIGAALINVNDCFGGMEVMGEFAWRNNDGVKPEYNGLIDVCFECGTVSHNESAIDFEWSLDDENYIAKWRPVVSMHNHTELKPRRSFVTAISIDGPKFWNKSMPIFSCPCVAANVEAIKPAVSPKEDKPMKPVYTAEMHARNELPPVDSKVIVCIEEAGFELEGNGPKYEGKVVTVKAAFVNKDGKKLVAIENDKGNCTCYIIECIKPIIKTIKVNGFDVPAPMSEAPEIGDEYFTPQTGYAVFYCANKWICDGYDHRFLSRGLVHATESAAIAHAKAMLGIDPNA